MQLVLFGMGMMLTFGDFRRVLTMPRAIGVGMLLQYTILPLVSLGFVTLFGLTGGAVAGLVLIGSVPGAPRRTSRPTWRGRTCRSRFR